MPKPRVWSPEYARSGAVLLATVSAVQPFSISTRLISVGSYAQKKCPITAVIC